jgi:3'-5' exoribonuclease Rv2179c-like domain
VKFYFDTEFIEDGKVILPLSIGIVAENGSEYYAEFANTPLWDANEFVKENVFPNLKSYDPSYDYLTPVDLSEGLTHIAPEFRAKYTEEIKKDILAFCGESPELWAYFADYDWVIMCQIFGRMVDLPKDHGWPMICLDIKQEMVMANLTKKDIPFDQSETHNALDDARWNAKAHAWLEDNFYRRVHDHSTK